LLLIIVRSIEFFFTGRDYPAGRARRLGGSEGQCNQIPSLIP
jgi:hypothetical protein